MTRIENLPASIIVEICLFVDSTDLIHLRATSTKFLTVLSRTDEANVIWRNALANDFSFDRSSDSNTDTSQDNYLQTVGIHPQRRERCSGSSVRTSIFGYTLSEEGSVFTARSGFESWKNWSKARAIFYHRANSEIELTPEQKINGPYFLRAARLWRIIDNWCRSNDSGMFGDNLLATFEQGVAQNEGRFPSDTNCEAVHAFEAIFAFSDGQSGLIRVRCPNYNNPKLAMFGGYSVYDHESYTRLCATSDARYFRDRNMVPSNNVVISCNYNPRLLRLVYLDIENGTLNMKSRGTNASDFPAYRCDGDTKHDVGLLWMEEYARRLDNRYYNISNSYQIQGNDGNSFGMLSCFPSERSPLASRKVTHGIEVVASSVGAVEIMVVTYSIRIRILTEGEEGYMTPQERGFDTCQLLSRHWKFHDLTADSVDQVSGDGVVGRYPLLREGGYRNDSQNMLGAIERGEEENGIFQYQSCASIASGTFEGQLKFVPGSIIEPTGDEFFADLDKFTLNLYGDISY